jgi:poly-gamma-glutamate capsule biosynthesis protein CapA/YwtB (metallophosphatase superfamily)
MCFHAKAGNNLFFMNKYWKITLAAFLLILAIIFGLSQRKTDPYVFRNKIDITDPDTREELQGYYAKGQDTAKEDLTKSSVTFLAVGDIMLSRNVAGTALKANDPALPFRKMEQVFNSVDFTFANLESPFSGKDGFNPSGSLVFNAPRNMIQGLIDYKIRGVTLANNHALDQGESGVLYTLQFLDEKGIKHTGAGKTLEEAWQPAIVEQRGVKLCFIGASYSSINDSGAARNEFVARIDDIENLKLKIEYSKSLCDFVVAAMHAGTEYVTKPNQAQVDCAHAAIDFGADMVIAHHPHWVQTIERYAPNGPSQEYRVGVPNAPEGPERSKCGSDKYIFYSLGNFIFDQEWSRETKEGLTLKIKVTKNQISNLQGPKVPATLESIELIPVVIENYSTPRPATAEEAKRILERIGQTDTILK